MSDEPYDELSTERVNPGARANVGAYTVVVSYPILLHLLMLSLKRSFSVVEVKAAAKEEGTPLERAKVEGRTQGALTGIP